MRFSVFYWFAMDLAHEMFGGGISAVFLFQLKIVQYLLHRGYRNTEVQVPYKKQMFLLLQLNNKFNKSSEFRQ